MWVVSRETWPSQARIVFISTPDRSRCTAVVCRIVCALICLADKEDNFRLADCTDRLTRALIPNLVIGCLQRFKNTASPGLRPATRGISLLAVCGHKGHRRTLPPFPLSMADGESGRSKAPIVRLATSLARAPELYKKSNKAWSRIPCELLRLGAFSNASIS